MASCKEAYLRHAQNYLCSAGRLQVSLDADKSQIAENVRTLAAKWTHMRRVVEWASKKAVDDLEVAEVCSRLVDLLQLFRKHISERELVCWMQAGIRSAQMLGNLRAEASHVGNLAVIYFDCGKIDWALQNHAIAQKIAEEHQILDIEFAQWLGMANCHLFLCRYDLATYGYHRALNISRWLGDSRKEALCITNLGILSRYKREGDAGTELHQDALELARKSHDLQQESLHLSSLGAALRQQGDYGGARKTLLEALGIARMLEDWQRELCIHEEIARICIALEDYAGAAERLSEALRIAHEHRYRVGRSELYGLIAEAYARKGDTVLALHYYEVAFRHAKEIEHTGSQIGYLVNMAAIQASTSNYLDALRSLRSAELLLGGLCDESLALHIWTQLATILCECQMQKSAGKYLTESFALIEKKELLQERAHWLLLKGREAALRHKYEEAAACHERGVYLSQTVRRADLMCKNADLLAKACIRSGRYRKAKHAIRIAIHVALKEGVAGEAARLTLDLGECFRRLQEFNKAVRINTWGLRMARQQRNVPLECCHMHSLARTFMLVGRHSDALRCIDAIHGYVKGAQLKVVPPTLLMDFGDISFRLRQFNWAAECYDLARIAYRSSRDSQHELQAAFSLAMAIGKSGRSKTAVRMLKHIVSEAKEPRDYETIVNALNELGQCYAEDEPSRALSYHQRALAMCQQAHDVRRQATMLCNVGVDHYLLKEYRVALNHFEQAFSFAGQAADTHMQALSLFNMGDACLKLGDVSSAYLYAEKAIAIAGRTDIAMAQDFRRQMDSWQGGNV